MASEIRPAPAGLTDTAPPALYRELAAGAHRFDFFHALRCLACLHPELDPPGSGATPAREPVRLGQQPSMAFAPSTIAGFDFDPEGDIPPRLEVLFFGLFGPNGPLPLHLTEYARDRLRNANDPALARFADIFHHRLLGLFYRAWADSEPVVQQDRPAADLFARRLGSLCGIGSVETRAVDTVPDTAKLYHSGRLGCHARNPEGLAALLSDQLRLPVQVSEFVGQWLAIEPGDELRLDANAGALGMTTLLGERVWDCQSKFRLIIGPLSRGEFESLLPAGGQLRTLAALVRNYLGDEFDWDLQPILKREEVAPARLGEFANLGWNSWLSHETPAENFAELIIAPILDC